MKKGCYLAPAVLADLADGMQFLREGVFGTLTAVPRFDDEDVAIASHNGTQFGPGCQNGLQAIEQYTQVRALYANSGRVWCTD